MPSRVEVWIPFSIAVESADYGGSLILNGRLDSENSMGQYVTLYDHRQGSHRCLLSVEGQTVNRPMLLQWFSATKSTRVDLTMDDSRYRSITHASFREMR